MLMHNQQNITINTITKKTILTYKSENIPKFQHYKEKNKNMKLSILQDLIGREKIIN